MLNVRSYKKMIRESKVGDTFYYNAIAGSLAMVDYTRELIQEGKIAPVQEELDKVINNLYPDVMERYQNGTSIAPQMTYIVLK